MKSHFQNKIFFARSCPFSKYIFVSFLWLRRPTLSKHAVRDSEIFLYLYRFNLPLWHLPRENGEQNSTAETLGKNCYVALHKPKSTLRLSCFLWRNFLKQCPKSFNHLNRCWWDGSSWSIWISGHFSVIFLLLNNYQVTWSRRHSVSKEKTTGLRGRKPGE